MDVPPGAGPGGCDLLQTCRDPMVVRWLRVSPVCNNIEAGMECAVRAARLLGALLSTLLSIPDSRSKQAFAIRVTTDRKGDVEEGGT